MKNKKKFRVGMLIFYILYVLGIAAFFVGLHYATNWLDGWLTDYEAAQPDVKCRAVFAQLFEKPDWEALYTQAGCSDTEYESAKHYAAYMTDRQGDRALTWHETSAGLSNDKKYIVSLGEEKVATFTLTSHTPEGIDAIPVWELGQLELFFTRQASVTVNTNADCTVYINGVALTEAHVIKTLHTEAERYLPEGTHGLRRQWLHVDGLLTEPEITAVDAQGQPVSLVYDAESGMYVQEMTFESMTQEQMDTVEKAARSYCLYMIRQSGLYDMRKLFDTESEIYQTIASRGPWVQDYKSYKITEPEFYGYYRYSDSLYSVVLKMSIFVTSNWGSVKEFPMETTFFLERQEDGRWLVNNMTNVDVQKVTTLVRLTYVADGQVIATEMVDAAAMALTVPTVSVPEGKEFAGWYRMETDEAGKTVYSLAFMPDEAGLVTLSGEQVLESMELHALFQ